MSSTDHTAYAGYDWARGADGIVTVTMDDPNAAVNTMNRHFVDALGATVDRLEAERDDITGVILASAKRSWFAGGDLTLLRTADPSRTAEEIAHIEHVKSLFRRIERLGRPVVAAMNGAALGGGLEVALACHHRIAAADAPGARFGLPEVSLGLLPGGGGVTRVVRMLGLQRALQEVILPATRFRAEDAVAVGIVDEAVPLDEIEDRARAWIEANPAPVQPWDDQGFRIPGGGPDAPTVAATLPMMPAMLRARTNGAPLPAPRAALAAAVEGAHVGFETASRIETRYFVSLTHTQEAKNMISAAFFDPQWIEAGRSRPAGVPHVRATRVEVVGGGPTGAALAAAAAKAGIEVTRRDAAGDDALEVVMEPVSSETQAAPSTLRVALLDHNSAHRPGTVGLHVPAVASPSPIVEVVRGADEAASAAAFDFVRQLRRTPIVVDGARGLFTSRVLGAFLAEAVAAVGEGVEPASVEQAALQAGHPAGPLALVDGLSLPLVRGTRPAVAHARAAHPSDAVLDWMVEEADRPGRAAGRGFHEYDGEGRRLRLWPGLRERFGSGRIALPLGVLQERMLFAQALEALACLDEGAVASVAEANIASVQGTGFPVWTGGALRYVDRYEGGPAGFVARARELAAAHGDRFEPPASLVARADCGERLC